MQARGLGSAFVPGSLDTGFLGVGHLLPALTATGRLPIAYRLLENEHFPSWGYSIKHGATTIWERWDGWTDAAGFQSAGMNSFNHYSLGSVGDWLYRTVAGIEPDPDAVGFERFTIRPRPGGTITRASATHDCIRGRIEVDWSVDDGAVRLAVVVPTNTTATVWVPGCTVAALTEGGAPVATVDGVDVIGEREGAAVVSVGGGTYDFRGASRAPTAH
jgi:alpha-L-rhamnosidase